MSSEFGGMEPPREWEWRPGQRYGRAWRSGEAAARTLNAVAEEQGVDLRAVGSCDVDGAPMVRIRLTPEMALRLAAELRHWKG
jgi:hypothetical protein